MMRATMIVPVLVCLLVSSASAQMSSEDAYARLRLRIEARASASAEIHPTAKALLEEDRLREREVVYRVESAPPRREPQPVALALPFVRRTVDTTPSALASGNLLTRSNPTRTYTASAFASSGPASGGGGSSCSSGSCGR